MILPDVVEEVVKNNKEIPVPNDTVINEIEKIALKQQISFAMALYMLGFETYNGFHLAN